MIKINKMKKIILTISNINIISLYIERLNIQIMKIEKKQFLSALILSNMNIISLYINI